MHYTFLIVLAACVIVIWQTLLFVSKHTGKQTVKEETLLLELIHKHSKSIIGEIQTRSTSGELKFFDELVETVHYVIENPEVWKISFAVDSLGNRHRYTKQDNGFWIYDPIIFVLP